MTTNFNSGSAVRPAKFTIEASDGWRLCLHVIDTQAPDSSAPVLLVFPALAAATRIYTRMALSFVKKGYRLVLADPRGSGESGPLPSTKVDYGITQLLERDWPAVVGWAKRRYPSAPIVLLGHSLGGQLSAIYAGQHPGSVAAVILLNVSFVWYRNWSFPSSWALWFIFLSSSLIARVVGYFPGNRLGLGHPVAKMVIQDWARWGRRGKYTTEDGNELETYLERVTGPVLSVSFTDDWFYGPRSAVDDFARRLKHSRLTRWHLSPAELEAEELGHFRYLKHSCQLWERIHQWLNVQLPRTAVT